MALTPLDAELLKRCLAKSPGSWNDFVDRFLSLIYHTIQYTAHMRSVPVSPEDLEDIASEVMLQIVADNYKVLRAFRGKASLATYIVVITRRTCIHELNRRQTVRKEINQGISRLAEIPADESEAAAKGIESLEEVEKLLRKLHGKEREICRQYWLQARSYEEISTELNVPVNSIGSVITRARTKLRDRLKSSAEIPAVKVAKKK